MDLQYTVPAYSLNFMYLLSLQLATIICYCMASECIYVQIYSVGGNICTYRFTVWEVLYIQIYSVGGNMYIYRFTVCGGDNIK